MVWESTTQWWWAHSVEVWSTLWFIVGAQWMEGGSPLHGRNQHRATTITTTMGNPGHPGELIYVCYCSIPKRFILTGMPSEIKKKDYFFN